MQQHIDTNKISNFRKLQ